MGKEHRLLQLNKSATKKESDVESDSEKTVTLEKPVAPSKYVHYQLEATIY